MSQQGSDPVRLADPIRFARDARVVRGNVAVAGLGRLADQLTDGTGTVAWEVVGEVGEDRKARLLLTASGALRLRCQRCLGALEWPLSLSTTLLLVPVGQPIPEEELEDDEQDAIEAVADMDVVALVEEEILLALPIAPRHDDCEVPRPESADEKKSPFAALAGLKIPTQR
ncbi:metal-binding protein [Pseudothauera nasutitermitis]|uniref:Large ribosomal RNA subunit accumulation protein YceD n=1 Tax=Pseudothauera nasutitermitis TaxID=2565930 RepID=A0A4S4B3B7_9RHOO|nr:YceD family protein [Pseudothauera nasutitermitis]THF67157.1 metal-binding protein [Pseudothauera nasutitermitis]